MLLHGRMFISKDYVMFNSELFGHVTKVGRFYRAPHPTSLHSTDNHRDEGYSTSAQAEGCIRVAWNSNFYGD